MMSAVQAECIWRKKGVVEAYIDIMPEFAAMVPEGPYVLKIEAAGRATYFQITSRRTLENGVVRFNGDWVE